MIIVDNSKVQDLKEIEKIIEEEKHDSCFSYVGMGESARVYRYGNYAIKLFHNQDKECELEKYSDYDYLVLDYENIHDSFCRELNAMEVLNNIHCNYVPKLFAYKENSYLIKEYIDGDSQDLYIILNDMEHIEDEMIELFNRQLQELKKSCDEIGIVARDCNENNILIVDDMIKVIDLGEFISK